MSVISNICDVFIHFPSVHKACLFLNILDSMFVLGKACVRIGMHTAHHII